MKTLIWKLKYIYYMVVIAQTSPKLAYYCATVWVDTYGMDETPRSAVIEELSNWSD